MNCKCANKHVPKPLTLIEVFIGNEKVLLCPTSYDNMMVYMDEWRRHGGRPPGSVRKHYSLYIQQLAEEIYGL